MVKIYLFKFSRRYSSVDPRGLVVKAIPLITSERKGWSFESSHCQACNFTFFVQTKTFILLPDFCVFCIYSGGTNCRI